MMKKLFVSLFAAATFVGPTIAQQPGSVTPVTGESWISHLHRALEQTSMGRTGQLGPPLPTRVVPVQSAEMKQRFTPADAAANVTLQGADLYRLNCQGCHGEFGQGAPPEINSVIEPSRATSAQYTFDRLKKRGLDASRAQAAEMANQAKAALLQRLHKGGVEMPPFPHFSEPEVRAIFAYLRQLSEIPGAEQQQIHLQEPSVRVGEHIVKSTCHICHSAVGVNPNGDELMSGAIPPLSSLTARVNLAQFKQKVRHGAPIMMGTPMLPYRGRMPVFSYLTDAEVADAYLYLTQYPPSAWQEPADRPGVVQLASAIEPIGPNDEPPKGGQHSAAPAPRSAAAPREAHASSFTFVKILAGVIVGLLIVGGAAFTVYDVRRSKPRAIGFLGLGGPNLAAVPQGGSSAKVQMPDDADKQAVRRPRLHRSEHDIFESTWFSPELESEDGAA